MQIFKKIFWTDLWPIFNTFFFPAWVDSPSLSNGSGDNFFQRTARAVRADNNFFFLWTDSLSHSKDNMTFLFRTDSPSCSRDLCKQIVRLVVSPFLRVTSLFRPVVSSPRCSRFLFSICHLTSRFVSSRFCFVVSFRLFDCASLGTRKGIIRPWITWGS